MKKYHKIINLKFDSDFLILNIDGERKQFRLKEISEALEKASDEERNTYEISPSGYGIHWPLIDEDLSIDGLLGIVHKQEKKRKSA